MRKLVNKGLILIVVLLFIFPFSSQISMAVSYDYEGHWAEQTIKMWIEKGYIKMYEDGSFRPDNPITRVEFLAMVNKLFDLTEVGDVVFSDVLADDWYYEAVGIASKAGYIVGKADNSFGPSDFITREEASAMLGRVLGLEASQEQHSSPGLRDSDQISEFAKLYVDYLIEKDLLQGYSDQTFRPTDFMSRGEAVVLIDRAASLLSEKRTYYTDKVAVLMYHSVREDYKHDNCINVDVFKQQIKMLKNSGFNVISLDNFTGFLEGRNPVPANAVLITFDDGYEDFYKLAYPILEELEVPATMFTITSKIADKTGWNPKLDEQQIQEMSLNNISFGSHSHDGHYLVSGPGGQEDAYLITRVCNNNKLESYSDYYARVYNDLLNSKEVLDNLLEQDTRVLALPYGKGSSMIHEIADLIGLDFIFTVKPGVIVQETDKLSLPRINAGYSSISDEELKNIILRQAR